MEMEKMGPKLGRRSIRPKKKIGGELDKKYNVSILLLQPNGYGYSRWGNSYKWTGIIICFNITLDHRVN